ncbi:MAG: hypothetical protein HZB35_00410 [Nitrospirae bacterium]|nr:hypothetical protein [Nitrospirota bacterium]
MRTTIEIRNKHRAKLLELAARRGCKGFSAIIDEAIEHYLAQDAEQAEARRRALTLRGTLSRREANRLRADTAALRRSWRF